MTRFYASILLPAPDLARPSTRRSPWLMGVIWLLLSWGIAPCVQAQTFVWAKQMAGSSYASGNGVAVDGAGNVYTTGYFQGTVDFDPGPGVFNLNPGASPATAIFVSKLDAAGNFVWARQMNGPGTNVGSSIAVDGAGNVITTGYFNQTVDFDPGAGTLNLTSAGGLDIFVSKLNAAGNLVWAKRIGETAPPPNTSAENADQGNGVTVDGAGNVYYTGSFRNDMDFDPGSGVVTLRASEYIGVAAIFVSKLDAAGNFVWAKVMKGGVRTDATGAQAIGSSESYGVAVDGAGNVYTTGYFKNIVDFDPGAGTVNLISSTDAQIPRGSPDVFVSKLDPAGNFVWARGMGDTGDDQGRSIEVDGAGNVTTTGFFTRGQVSGTADFDPGPGVFTLSPQTGQYDNFVSKLDAAGNFVSARLLRDYFTDTGNGMAVDAGYVYTTGQFQGTVDFDPGPGVYNLTAMGSSDIFVSKVTGPLRLTTSATSPACAGSMIGLSVAVTGETAPYSYTWVAPAGITLQATSTSAVVANIGAGVSGTQTFTVAVAAAGGSPVSTGLLSVTVLTSGPTVVYVTQAGAGSKNGSNWANAYAGTSLQTAINAASASSAICGKQVWVAAGTYKPTSTTDRDATYTMQPGVAIYGGFVGTETQLSQRQAISTTVPPSTTLSADIANNINVSAYNLFRNGNNLTSTAVLDGFVLAFALANNTGAQQGKAFGGAMYNEAVGGVCSPTIRNCWFMNNTALTGGGALWNYASNGGEASPTIENCRFQNNSVQAGSGGAIHNRAQSATGTLNYTTRSSPKVLNCLFINNACSGGNSGYDGGGAIHTYAYGGTASPTFMGCSFQANSSTVRGGAICTNGSDDGAGSYIGTARPVLTNCSFQANSAPAGQGPVMANIHFNNNGSSTNANATLLNCIVVNNNGTVPFFNASGATVSLSYSLFETGVGGQPGNSSGTGNISTSVSPFASTTGTQLAAGSAAINAGDPAFTPTGLGAGVDLAGNPRIAGGRIDMGAYEYGSCPGPITTVKAGMWSDPTVWSCGVVPFPTDMVQVNHVISLPTNYMAQLQLIRFGAGGILTYQTGASVRLGN